MLRFNQAFHQALRPLVKGCMQPLALRAHPFVVETRQQFAAVQLNGLHQGRKQALAGARVLQGRRIQPVGGPRVKAEIDLVDEEEVGGGERLADAPQRRTQIGARIGIGGVRPQQPGQPFAPVQGTGRKGQVRQQGLRRSRWEPAGAAQRTVGRTGPAAGSRGGRRSHAW